MKLSMTRITITAFIAMALVVLGTKLGETDPEALAQGSSRQELLIGQRIYEANCAVCHGQRGDGMGMAAHMLVTQPRDFRRGLFKFRSTASGSLPTDDDLLNVVTNGIRWTAMVARADLIDSERRAVMQYVKTFYPGFGTDHSRSEIVVAPEPVRSQEVVAQGRRLYQDAGCAQCHGDRGQGDGVSSADLTDGWARRLPASDLTWRPLKRGTALRGIYLTIATGLNGTSMPAYADSIDPQQIWALVYFLESLVPQPRRLASWQTLGEEQRGWMILRMGGMMGHGTMHR
jgi:cytochrome c oxidase cbb3-type subunit 2